MYYKLRVNVVLFKNLKSEDSYYEIVKFLNFNMLKSNLLKILHEKKGIKLYIFSPLSPIQKKFYLKNEIYSFIIQSTSEFIIKEFQKVLRETENKQFIVIDLEIIKKNFPKQIEILSSISPISITLPKLSNEKKRQWNIEDGHEILKKCLVNNLGRKFNAINGKNEKFNPSEIIEKIKITGFGSFKYKNIKKVGIYAIVVFKKNYLAQELAKIGLALGLGNSNSSMGYGYMFLKLPHMKKIVNHVI